MRTETDSGVPVFASSAYAQASQPHNVTRVALYGPRRQHSAERTAWEGSRPADCRGKQVSSFVVAQRNAPEALGQTRGHL